MSQNGCLGSTDPIGCSAVNNGMFNNGLHQALLTYSDMMTAFATARIDSLTLPVGNGTSGPGSELLTSPEWARIPAVAAYIESGLRYAAQLRMDQLNAVGNTFDEITAILTVRDCSRTVCMNY